MLISDEVPYAVCVETFDIAYMLVRQQNTVLIPCFE